MTLQLKKNGKTLIDLLNKIYKKYGSFLEAQLSIPFGGGKEGMAKMKTVMETLRKSPPKEINGQKVIEVTDYLSDHTALPQSNVLLFRVDDHSKFVIRPSGTEPKIKIYGLVRHNEKGKLDASLESLKSLLLKTT